MVTTTIPQPLRDAPLHDVLDDGCEHYETCAGCHFRRCVHDPVSPPDPAAMLRQLRAQEAAYDNEGQPPATVEDAARVLGVSRRQWQRLNEQGKVPALAVPLSSGTNAEQRMATRRAASRTDDRASRLVDEATTQRTPERVQLRLF